MAPERLHARKYSDSTAPLALVACAPPDAIGPLYAWSRGEKLSLAICHLAVHALHTARQTPVALMVLGEPPDAPPSQLLRAFRRQDAHVPILQLGASWSGSRGAEVALQRADYSIPAPFSELDLIEGLDRVWRSRPREPRELVLGPVRIDFVSRELIVDGVPQRLTKKRFDLLTYLVLNANRSIAIDELALKVVGTLRGDPRRIPKDIHALRHALGNCRFALETRQGGYRFDVDALGTSDSHRARTR
jgi:DNA-binding response OmpR family regulator